ncbi:MAG TPA: hypothetical protein VD926_00930, partial [Acidimicrobiales bacterium]|nr:hypothetical protein [Acidimicrobiales bacterium]
IHLVGPPGQADPVPGLVVDDDGHATYSSISVSGRGHGCGQDGWYDVVEHEVDTDGTVLTWTVRFEARCFEDDSPPRRGEIHYDADDPVAPPTPGPIPDDLWQPDPTSIPAEGTVVHLESSPGEWIVQREVTLTPSNSDLEVEARPPHRSATARVEVSTRTPSFWNGRFSGNWTMDQLQPGFYPDTNRSPFQNPAEGGIDWSGEGRGCNTIDGWLAVDEISYAEDGTLDHLVLRFQQHCGNRYQGFDPPLRGYVRYDRPAPAP